MSSLNIVFRKILLASFKVALVIFYLLFSFALISLIIPPHIFWVSGIAVLFIPFFIFLNLILLILFVIQKYSVKWIALLFFISSSYYFFLLYRIPFHSTIDQQADFKLLSYNISGYRITGSEKPDLYNYILGKEADILCLQEFHSGHVPFLDFLYPYHAIEAGSMAIGVAIFSKYPIFNKGIVFGDPKGFNKGVFADINIHGKIIRVISVHLESNGLQRGNPFVPLKKLVYNINALKNTSGIRSLQANKLVDFINTSTYPTIVAGDFNEPPYSYVYLKMRQELKNSFEEKGSGFGFTFFSQKAMLRIDHHFTNDFLRVDEYTSYPEVRISDHVPAVGMYSFTN